MNVRAHLIVIALMAFLAGWVHAQADQAVDASKPESVAGEALAALKDNRIDDFAALMHPQVLREFKAGFLPILDAAQEAGREKQMLDFFGHAESIDAVRELDEFAFFAAFMRGTFSKYPQLQQVLADTTSEIIGHVPEDPDLVHVVYRARIKLDEMERTRMTVITLKAHEGTWRLLLLEDMRATTAAVKRMLDFRN